MAQFGGHPTLEYSNEDEINNRGRIGRRPSPGYSGVSLHYDYLKTYNSGRIDAQPRSNTIPNELKKRVEAAAKEFNFTMADIGRVEKALNDQNSKRNSGIEANLFQDDVKIRVAAAINKYKFTPEEIATVQKAVRDQKSMNSVFNPNVRDKNLMNSLTCDVIGSDFNGNPANSLRCSAISTCRGDTTVNGNCNIL